MTRLPRISPDVPLQYKQYTIPAGVRSRLLTLALNFPLMCRLGSGRNVILLHAYGSRRLSEPRRFYPRAMAWNHQPPDEPQFRSVRAGFSNMLRLKVSFPLFPYSLFTHTGLHSRLRHRLT